MSNQRSRILIGGITLTAMCFAQLSLAQSLGQGYRRDGNTILFEGKRIDQEGAHDIREFAKVLGHQLTLCNNIDAASFQVLSEEYTKDKSKVYFKWISPGRFWVVELPIADVASFEVLGSNLARDKNRVWMYDKPLPGADSATIELVRDGFVWKDTQHVWYQHERYDDADPETFQFLASGYYADAKRAYWGRSPIEDVDLATFRVLGESPVAIDQNTVYRSGQRMPQIDADTCKFILHDPYGYQVISDKNGVYLNKLKFLHAEPSDFEMIDERTGRGGKYVFLVDTYHSTPVTVYREDNRLITETILYEKGTINPLAIVKAEVLDDKLGNISFVPAPGKPSADPVPDWQIKVFQRPALVQRMKAAGELLTGEIGGSTNR